MFRLYTVFVVKKSPQSGEDPPLGENGQQPRKMRRTGKFLIFREYDGAASILAVTITGKGGGHSGK